MIARILIDLKVKSLNKLFDYIVNEEDIDNIKIGMRVIVPFGKIFKLGYVFELTQKSDVATKKIVEILDIIPTISDEAFLYFNFLKRKNSSMFIEILKTIIPNELFLRYEQRLLLKDKTGVSIELLPFFNNNDEIKYSRKLKLYKKEIERLIRKNKIEVKRIYFDKVKEKTVQTVKFIEYQKFQNIDKYADLINYVKNNSNHTKTMLVEKGFKLSQINTLIKNNVFIIEQKRISRDAKFNEVAKIEEHALTLEQRKICQKIEINKKKIYLLKGVTGSGKTEIYMKVMKDVLKSGKNILYLVPEIILVAPTMNQLSSRFSEKIVHFNSNLSQAERFDAWNEIITNQAKIIVGTRSSSFLPINNLGLIIVDEEHDDSYIQQSNIRYDVIDILKIKANFHKCPIILGSATPRVSTMFHALNKKYELLELKNRVNNVLMPKVTFVDMKQELKTGNTKIFSKILHEKIIQTIIKGEQVILLYNRKGYYSYVMCKNCFYVPRCPNCNISLKYHKQDKELKCSYCEYKEKMQKVCPKCRSNAIEPMGMAIDRVFEIVQETFKDARILKMDAETTSTKGDHEKLWMDFKDHKYDILLGTQMISKGLDFPKATLVGILVADLQLEIPSFLAAEKTYALLTQMVGRSGRKMAGEAIIQGYNLENYAISSVNKNYYDFYKEAIYHREISRYEPFYNVTQLLITGDSFLTTYQNALMVKEILRSHFDNILGPSAPSLKFFKNKFRFLITIKTKEENDEKIIEIINELNNIEIEYLSIPDLI